MVSVVRSCVECGKNFEGTCQRCWSCTVELTCATEQACTKCGTNFKGTGRRCGACRRTWRSCSACDTPFKGTYSSCPACRPAERACMQCGRTFKGSALRCPACRPAERTCIRCNATFKGTAAHCPACRETSQPESIPPEVRRAQSTSQSSARRARQLAAEVAGPVPPEVYEAIRASGPCVYCAAPAPHVDHVRPLSRGGWEHASNLVPACAACNFSKGAKLLTEWRRPVLVEHAVAHSPKVAAEWARLTAAVAQPVA